MLHKYESECLYGHRPQQLPNHIRESGEKKKSTEANKTMHVFFSTADLFALKHIFKKCERLYFRIEIESAENKYVL